MTLTLMPTEETDELATTDAEIPANVEIPYCPRPEFVAFHERKQRFAKLVCHRRFGKTVATINDLVKHALLNPRRDPPPRYAYIAPTYIQAKDVAWSYLKHYSAGIPGVQISEGELWVRFPNGARIRLYGADNYDRMRGLYHDGVVIDEPAQQDPRAWPEVIRPTLSDFAGWATFIGTPSGRNWFFHIGRLDTRQVDRKWFHLTLKASETLATMRADRARLGIDWDNELESARSTLTAEQYAQEYECSFEAAILGAYYGRLMAQIEAEKRICGVPHDAAARVWTAWDLGISDATAIWFVQSVGREIHVIDYYENSGHDLGHYAKEIYKRDYIYAGHIVPHDAQARELGTGKNRLEVLENLGLRNVSVCAPHRVEDGINAVRTLLPRCWFDAEKCQRGYDALRLYRSEWDDKLQTLRAHPVHDWASHAADAFRYLAMAFDRRIDLSKFNRQLEMPAWGLA